VVRFLARERDDFRPSKFREWLCGTPILKFNLCQGMGQLECKFDQSSPSSFEVKNECCYTSDLPTCLCTVHSDNFIISLVLFYF
jgi:hypothetical protein